MIEKNIQQTREKKATISIPNYTLQNYEEKRVVLKSRSTKRDDSDTNHKPFDPPEVVLLQSTATRMLLSLRAPLPNIPS